MGLELDASLFSYFIAVTWQLLLQRLQLRKLSSRSEWPLLLLWIFLFRRYYRVKSMHMISAMDFFFISCIKCHSVNGGAVGPPARLAPSSSPTRRIWQLELICMELSLSICWLRCSRQLYVGVTLWRALLKASSSCSHPSLPNTCHCQSQGDNTQMTLSFGLIKSPGLFQMQPLQQIIAALKF